MRLEKSSFFIHLWLKFEHPDGFWTEKTSANPNFDTQTQNLVSFSIFFQENRNFDWKKQFSISNFKNSQKKVSLTNHITNIEAKIPPNRAIVEQEPIAVVRNTVGKSSGVNV